MSTILVWDIPNRMFHWMFTISITVALGIAFLVDDGQALFQVHMLAGIIAVFLVVLRLIMGVIGSRYSRFSSFPLHPRDVVRYFVNAFTSKTTLYVGNNPGSALAAILMFIFAVALFITGSSVIGEAGEEVHEVLAFAMLAVVILHLAGIVWHTIRHREPISKVMVTGTKAGKPEDAAGSAHAFCGVVFLILSGLWIAMVFIGFNPDTRSLRVPLVGVSMQLGENESDSGTQQYGEEHDD